MATVNSFRFVSRCSNVNNSGASSCSETGISFAQTAGIRNQTMTHNGLRSLNKLDITLQTGSSKRIATTSGRGRGPAKSGFDKRLPGPIRCGKGMNLVFVGTEVGPWSKTGGLGDVLGGLPPAMAAIGHRVMTVSPRYDQYKDAWDTSVLLQIKIGDKTETVRFFHCYKRGVDRVFVDHPLFLEKVWGKTASKIYGPKAGDDYDDNQIRYSLLCQLGSTLKSNESVHR